MIFADRRLTIFGRAPDIKHLVGRATAKGLTAIAAPPKMGKTWLLIEVARKLSEEDGRLVGYAESVGQSADLMLRAVADLYTRWLDNASYREQAKSLWQRHQGELITGAGQAVGAIFESFAETTPLKPVAKLVRECFDALARADTDHIEDFEHRLSRHWHHLNRAKWKVWHGNLYGASIALSSFYDGVDIHVMTAEADSGQSSVEQVRERLVELWSYLTANQTRLINYGREYRDGPSHFDGARGVDCGPIRGLADGEEATYALDPTRRADVAPRALCATQRRTKQIHSMVGLRIIAGAVGWRHEPPGSFRSPIKSNFQGRECKFH